MPLDMSRTAKTGILSLEERQTLETWVRGRNLPHHQVVRAKIITMAADWVSNAQDLQAQPRPALCREVCRCRRALP